MTEPDPQQTHDERLIARLAADLPSSPEQEGLDPNLIAGFIEGRLADDERERVIEQLDRSPTARAQLSEARALVGAEASAPTASAGTSAWRWVAAAAAVLLAVGGSIVLWARSDPSADEPTLSARVAQLRDRDPTIFRDFQLVPENAMMRSIAVERGGLVVMAPRGALLRAQLPAIRWSEAAGARAFRVRVRDDEGTLLLDQTAMQNTLTMPSPPRLKEGASYVVVVETDTPTGQLRGSQAFHVLSKDEAMRYRKGKIVIENDVPASVRSIVSSHWALHFDLLTEALSHIHTPTTSEKGMWEETLEHVNNRLGLETR